MVMLPQPIRDAVDDIAKRLYWAQVLTCRRAASRSTSISPSSLPKKDDLIILCGHYEGVDQRALDIMAGLKEDAGGDALLTGGELAAMVIVDAVARLVPGVLGSEESPLDESFSSGLLEYPQYTRPREYRGCEVPEVLLNGQSRCDSPLAQGEVARTDLPAQT